MAWPPILVRYGEIGIKSRNIRSQFERRLADRIEEGLIRRGVEAEIKREEGRIMVRANDVDRALDALKHTFGVVSASPAVECESTPDAVAAAALEIAQRDLKPGQSFAMRCKRSGNHDFTSLDVAKTTASLIFEALKDRAPRVDLDNPDVPIYAEVRGTTSFVYDQTVRGPGGLPLGSQGKVAVLVDGPRAAHAAWLMGKRGAALAFLGVDEAQTLEWLKPLVPCMGTPRIHPLIAGTRGEQLDTLHGFLVKHHCHALVVGDDIHQQLASWQEDQRLGFPIFRPLVGYSGERFRAFARLAELPEDVEGA